MNKAMQFLLRGLLMTTMLFVVSAVAQDAHTTGQFRGDDDGKALYLCAKTGLYRIRLNIPGIRP